MTRPLALTLGEPAGIGPDITLAAWCRRDEFSAACHSTCSPIPTCWRGARAARSGRADPCRRAGRCRARPSPARCRWLRWPSGSRAEPGHPDASSAPAAIASIRRAVADVFAGRAHAVVTNPIAKAVLYRERIRRARPHRVSGQARAGAYRAVRASGDDVVVAGARRRAGDHPPCRCATCRSASPAT